MKAGIFVIRWMLSGVQSNIKHYSQAGVCDEEDRLVTLADLQNLEAEYLAAIDVLSKHLDKKNEH